MDGCILGDKFEIVFHMCDVQQLMQAVCWESGAAFLQGQSAVRPLNVCNPSMKRSLTGLVVTGIDEAATFRDTPSCRISCTYGGGGAAAAAAAATAVQESLTCGPR
jgi:hypothetical protein